MKEWWQDELRGFRYSWSLWRSGETTWWQSLWGHNVDPWCKVPGFMQRFR